ncbi:MAG: GntR family transcriptional regulator [Janthinobacterium lividum]
MNLANHVAPDDIDPAQRSQTLRTLVGLRDLILNGELSPGARISELWVVERLGASRTPVRASLIRLQEEGLLEAIPTGGFAVRSFGVDEIYDAIELRGTLEGFAARLAAERGVAPDTLGHLHRCVEEIDMTLNSDLSAERFSRYVTLNERFHLLLASASGSRIAQRQIEKIKSLPFASPSAYVGVQALSDDARGLLLLAQAQHVAVVDALEHREGTRAESLMREHSRIAQRNLKLALLDQKSMSRIPGGGLIRHTSG